MVRKDRKLKTESLQRERNFLPRQKEKQSKKIKSSCKTVEKCVRIHSLQTSAKRYTGNKMALIEKHSASDLYNIACNMGRGTNFGYAGWLAIGDYLEQLSEDLGEDLEIDIIAICCEYSSADSVDEFWNEYGKYSLIDAEEWEEMDDEEKLEAVQDYLQENTSVVVCEENLFIWQAF